MRICVDTSLRPTIEGRLIDTAPSVTQLHALLGPPNRIATPKIPAPVGHRSNQLHVYESAGVAFYEHHYTRRIFGCIILFSPEARTEFGLNHCRPFSGALDIAGQELFADTDSTRVLPKLPR